MNFDLYLLKIRTFLVIVIIDLSLVTGQLQQKLVVILGKYYINNTQDTKAFLENIGKLSQLFNVRI